jgi:uncharacterized membrane protein YkoI
MLRSKIIPAAMAAIIAIGGTAAAVSANAATENERQQEINAVLKAKTSLTQAIAAAERETGGKAVETGLENQDGVMAYEVKIAKGDTLQNVLVDLASGKVIKVTAADANHEGGGENDEE